MIRRSLLLLTSLALCFTLASCGDDDTKGSSGDSGIPAYATSNDEKGAQGFARYWIDTLNAATTSGDTAKLKTLQKPSCETCTDFAEKLDKLYAAGGHIETEGFTVKSLVSEAGVPSPGAGVSATLTATEQKVYAKKGAAPQTNKAVDVRFRLIMIRDSDHWLMDRIDVG